MERRIMALTNSAHIFTHLLMLVYPTIAVVLAREWATDVATLLELAFPGFLLYGLCAVPFGIWADRAGGVMPVTLGLLGMGVGTVACAFAQAPWQLAVGLAIIGIFASAYHPAGLGLITHGVKRSAHALGVNGSFGSGAVALAPALAELLSEGLGWRVAFVVLGSPAVALGIWFFVRPLRVPHARRTEQEHTEPERLFTPVFLLLCVTMLAGGLAYRTASVLLPVLFDERVTFIGHGVATSLTYGLAVVMNYLGGRLAERYRPERVFLAFHLLSLPPLALAAWASGLPLLLLMAGYAACALGTQPAENSLLASLVPRYRRSVGFGVKFTLAFGVGAAAVPIVAYVLRRWDSHAAQIMLATNVTIIVVLATLLVLRRTRLAASGGAHALAAK